MILGIGIGIFYMFSLIIAFAAGYGWNKDTTNEEEQI